jgi:Caspase domain
MHSLFLTLLFGFLLPGVLHAQEPQRLALLIGNQGYSAQVGPLQNPINDIMLLGKALSSLGFKVTSVQDADYRAIDTAVKRHIQAVRKVGPNTLSFFYYSGHGAANPDTDINYLIPVDVKAADDDLWINAFELRDIVGKLQQQAPAVHYVVFDACRDELRLTGTRSLGRKGFVPEAFASGMMIAYATAPGSTASDKGAGGGPYARILAEEIVKPGVEAMTMFRNVALRVKNTIGQDPWLSASTLQEVYFAGQASGGARQSQGISPVATFDITLFEEDLSGARNIVRYAYGRSPTGFTLKYDNPYMVSVRNGDRTRLPPASWVLPVLSVKILNRSNETILLSEILIDVKSSTVNVDPVPFVHQRSRDGHLSLNNDGWGPMLAPKLNLKLSQKCTEPAALSRALSLPNIAESTSVDVQSFLPSALADQFWACSEDVRTVCRNNGFCMWTTRSVNDLKCDAADPNDRHTCRTVRTPAGTSINAWLTTNAADLALKTGEVLERANFRFVRKCEALPICVHGDVAYSTEGQQARQWRFETTLYLREPPLNFRPGGPPVTARLEPKRMYSVKLAAGRGDATYRVPVSHTLAPGEAEHILLALAADKSASFSGVIRLLNVDGSEIGNRNFNSDMFVSRAFDPSERKVKLQQ